MLDLVREQLAEDDARLTPIRIYGYNVSETS